MSLSRARADPWIIVLNQGTAMNHPSETNDLREPHQVSYSSEAGLTEKQIAVDRSLSPEHEKVVIQTTIPLLEERIVADYTRRKIGEVIVRKVVETRMVQVPIRYEKLIVEQINPEHKQLVELDLSNSDSDVELAGEMNSAIVQAEFSSPRVASQVLYELGKTLQHQCKQVRVEIELENADLSGAYQEWIEKFSQAVEQK